MAVDNGQLVNGQRVTSLALGDHAVRSDSAPFTGAPPVIQAAGLHRAFGAQVVLDGFDLTIHDGEFAALLGRSGSGKSTLLRAVAGLDQETIGQLRVVKRRGVVFQDARLVPWKGVLANVQLGSDGVQRERGRQLLEEVGLSGRERSWPKTLSGGEAQRVALARALARDPRLLLLDEPFGALDALTRIRMHQLLTDLIDRHRPAVLLVTHDVDEALRLASRVLVLDHGVINFDAPVPAEDTDRAELRSTLLAELGVSGNRR